MNPFRLFVILLLLTASALAIVYLRIDSARTAYRVQQLHARNIELRRQVQAEQAELARYTDPRRIQELIRLNNIEVGPRPVTGGGTSPSQPPDEFDPGD